MTRPNFIVFLTDDQGYGDLSCMGARDLATPNLDRLAAGGVRFTDWYSNSPVCSPSRAALLTGRYPGNAGVRSILAGHRTATGLPPHVPSLATASRRRVPYLPVREMASRSQPGFTPVGPRFRSLVWFPCGLHRLLLTHLLLGHEQSRSRDQSDPTTCGKMTVRCGETVVLHRDVDREGHRIRSQRGGCRGTVLPVRCL